MKKNGFSLVELSVVLIIIGLIIGGILVGKSMISTARNQSIISDWQKYSSAANNYFTKYGYWPGDDAEANNRWGTATSGGGDGALGDETNQEYMYYWQDLSLAGFITGTYTGAWGSVPKTQIPQSYMTHYYDSTYPTNQAFYLTGLNPAAGSKVGFSGETVSPVLSGPDALSIDTKIDDGLPNQQTALTGTVISNGTGTNCATGATAADIYQSTTTAVCNLYYIYKK